MPMLPLLPFVTVVCHSRRNNTNNGEYWKVTYLILSINDIVKIKVNSYKRTCLKRVVSWHDMVVSSHDTVVSRHDTVISS